MRAPSRRSTSSLQAIALSIAAVLSASAAQAQTVIINGTTETSPPFTVSITDDLYVGTTGTGALNVVSGTMQTHSTTLGDTATGVGTVTVTGAGFGGPGSNFTIGNAGTGTFSASDVSHIYSAATYIGALAGSSGTAMLSDSGSFWTALGNFEIGSAGSGALTVSNGAELTSALGATIGADAGSSGSVTLTGTGSTWTDMDSVYVGEFGTGAMTVSAGAVFNGFNLRLGDSDGSSGTVTLTGAGSEINLSSGLYIGYEGNGTFNVTDGATLNLGSNSLYIGYYDGQGVFNVSGGSTVISGTADLGHYSDVGKGTANISGAGTTWTIDGSLIVGNEGGAGELNITDGAHVSTTSYLTMGYYAEGITRGDLTISGAGSQLVVGGGAYIGYYAAASVLVSGGGLLQVDGDSTLASYYPEPADVTVTGAGSQWTMTGDLFDGYYGDATINVTNGGYVSAGGDAYFGYFDYGTTGGTAVISGAGSELAISGDAYIGYEGQGTVTVNNGGLLQVDGTSYLGDGNAGAVTVTGAGSRWITGDIKVGAYYSSGYPDSRGDVVVASGGTVEGASMSLGAYAGAPGTLLVTGSGSSVALTGALTVGDNGAGTATLANRGSLSTPSVTIAGQSGSQGTLIFGAAAGDAPVAAGTLDTASIHFGDGQGKMVFNITGSTVMDATLQSNSNAPQVNVRAGTVTFTGDATNFLGTTLVEGGKAVVSTTFGGYVTAIGTGIIAGTGTGGSLAALNGGTISPGNSIGTLHSAGALYFGPNSNYVVEVNSAGQSDRIDVAGSGLINGGTVHVSGAPALTTYTIITTAGGITGAFDGLDSASAFVDYRLDYDLNNVYLVVDGINSFTTAARTPNQYAVARALDQFPTSNPLLAAMLGQDVAGAQQAFNALSGEIHASVGTTLADDNRYVREAITGRLIQAYYGGGTSGSQPIVLASAAPTDVIDTSSRMSLGAGYGAAQSAPQGGHNLAYWSRAFGAWGQYDSNGNAATTDRNLGGFISGVDGALGGGWRVGLATGYMYTALDADARASSASVNSYVLGGYAGGALGGGFALRSGGTWTWSNIDTSRGVIFPGFFEWESANYNGDSGQLFAEVAYPLSVGNHVLEPFAGLAYVHVGTSSFTESGPVAGLSSDGSDENLGYGTLGARAGTTLSWGAMSVVPHASLAWQYAFGDTTPLQALAFASTGIGMGIGGVPLAQNSALLEIGTDVMLADDATLGLSYIGQYAGDMTDNGLRGRFNWKF